MPPFTVEQVRAAQAFLGRTQVDLGETGLSLGTVRNCEISRFPLSPANYMAMREAFKKVGIEFQKGANRICVTIPVPRQRW
jgi:hypothetical protein